MKEYSRGKLRNLTASVVENAIEQGISAVDQFFVNINITPDWSYVETGDNFNPNLSLNTTSTVSNQLISVLGTM
jgi:hypothetical protein